MRLAIDHIAIAATDLAAGVAAVEAALGVPMGPGGAHALMGTHNRLLGLGDVYLEVIAIDPAAPRPAFPRWFDLDAFQGRPRPGAWVLRCADLDAGLRALPEAGRALDLERGALRWRMGVPEGGRAAFDGLFPALITWQGEAPRLPDSGLRLRQIVLAHPQAPALAARLAPHCADPRLAFETAPAPALRFAIETPAGVKVLS